MSQMFEPGEGRRNSGVILQITRGTRRGPGIFVIRGGISRESRCDSGNFSPPTGKCFAHQIINFEAAMLSNDPKDR